MPNSTQLAFQPLTIVPEVTNQLLLNEIEALQTSVTTLTDTVNSMSTVVNGLVAATRADLERTGGLLDLTAKTADNRFDNLNAPVDQIPTSLVDISGLATSTQVTALPAAVEAALLNEGDGQQLIDALVTAIGNQNIDTTVLVAAIRADAERVGGLLDQTAKTSDSRFVNLDSPISGITSGGSGAVDLQPVLDELALKVNSNDPRLDLITTTNNIVNSLTISGGAVSAVVDKTGYSLTAQNIAAISTAVEASLLDESDGQQILNAIVGAIGNQNVDVIALVAAIRADLERAAGLLQNVSSTVATTGTPLQTNDPRLNAIGNPLQASDTRLDDIGVPLQTNDLRINAIGTPLQANDPAIARLDVPVSSRASTADVSGGTDLSGVETSLSDITASLVQTTADLDDLKNMSLGGYLLTDVNGSPTDGPTAVRQTFYEEDGTTIFKVFEGRDANNQPASGTAIVRVVPV